MPHLITFIIILFITFYGFKFVDRAHMRERSRIFGQYIRHNLHCSIRKFIDRFISPYFLRQLLVFIDMICGFFEGIEGQEQLIELVNINIHNNDFNKLNDDKQDDQNELYQDQTHQNDFNKNKRNQDNKSNDNENKFNNTNDDNIFRILSNIAYENYNDITSLSNVDISNISNSSKNSVTDTTKFLLHETDLTIDKIPLNIKSDMSESKISDQQSCLNNSNKQEELNKYNANNLGESEAEFIRKSLLLNNIKKKMSALSEKMNSEKINSDISIDLSESDSDISEDDQSSDDFDDRTNRFIETTEPVKKTKIKIDPIKVKTRTSIERRGNKIQISIKRD